MTVAVISMQLNQTFFCVFVRCVGWNGVKVSGKKVQNRFK